MKWLLGTYTARHDRKHQLFGHLFSGRYKALFVDGSGKGDPEKVAIALRLRRELTTTLSWIAQRLQMGTKTHLAHLLYWQGREGKKK